MSLTPHALRNARPSFFLIICLLIPNAVAFAQSATPPPPPGAAAQPPVRLNVIVTGESGRAAADVKQEEISVTEDGRPQTVARFAPEELPVSYGLVIDNSRSLASVFSSLIRAGELIASSNRAGDETFVMRFVDSNKIALLQDFTADFESVRDALASMYAEGGATAAVDALSLAVRHTAERAKAAAGRRHALVLISDCEDRGSLYKQSELIEQLRRANVQVFVIAMPGQMQDSPAKARKLAETIAAESGGRVFFVKKNNAAEIQSATEEIARNLRSQYTLEYQPTNAAADGKFRKIEVTATAKRKTYARPGYYAVGMATPSQPAKK